VWDFYPEIIGRISKFILESTKLLDPGSRFQISVAPEKENVVGSNEITDCITRFALQLERNRFS